MGIRSYPPKFVSCIWAMIVTFSVYETALKIKIKNIGGVRIHVEYRCP